MAILLYTANTGMATISTANSNLDGTGTLGTVLTAASKGTIIKTVTIKAQGNTSNGMVRLFIYDGTNTKLISEIEIPAVAQSATDSSFEITLPVNYALKSGWILKASTEIAEPYNVIAEGIDWAWAGSVTAEKSYYQANIGMATISTANSNLDGTGTLGSVLTASSSGTVIKSVTIKSQVSTSRGMIRLFIYDGTNTKLLREIPVPAVTKSATLQSFYQRIDFGGEGLALKNAWQLKASTQNAETFNAVAEGLNWAYL